MAQWADNFMRSEAEAEEKAFADMSKLIEDAAMFAAVNVLRDLIRTQPQEYWLDGHPVEWLFGMVGRGHRTDSLASVVLNRIEDEILQGRISTSLEDISKYLDTAAVTHGMELNLQRPLVQRKQEKSRKKAETSKIDPRSEFERTPVKSHADHKDGWEVATEQYPYTRGYYDQLREVSPERAESFKAARLSKMDFNRSRQAFETAIEQIVDEYCGPDHWQSREYLRNAIMNGEYELARRFIEFAGVVGAENVDSAALARFKSND